MTKGVPLGDNVRHNGKDYIVCENGSIYAVQRCYDNGHCFGRKPVVTNRFIMLNPEASMYKTIKKKLAGELGPNNAWNVNKKKELVRKNNSRTVTVSA